MDPICSVKKTYYKYCIVPRCKNTTISTPHKVFFSVPRNAHVRRKWCQVMGRDETGGSQLSDITSLYCCEDHFNLEEDTENYIEYKIMHHLQGRPMSLRLKKGAVPHRFQFSNMDDDMDIEEHDVLDNPAVRNLFPDISVLKEEIESYDKALEEDSTTDLVEFNYLIKLEHTTEDSDINVLQNERSEIIVGMEHVNNEVLPVEFIEDKASDLMSQSSETTEDFEEQAKVFNASVLLDDLRPYLERSMRYCEDCRILFPNTHAMEVHNGTVHLCLPGPQPLLKKEEKLNCRNSKEHFNRQQTLSDHVTHAKKFNITRKKAFTRNKIRRPKQPVSVAKDKCFHCNTIFPSQQSLIDHLYQMLQTKQVAENKSQGRNSSRENVSDQSETKSKNSTKFKIKKVNKICNTVKASHAMKRLKASNLLYFKCFICALYFKSEAGYDKHLVTKHQLHHHSVENKVAFNNICKHCSHEFRIIKSYNNHIKRCHKDIIYSTVPNNLDKVSGQGDANLTVSPKLQNFPKSQKNKCAKRNILSSKEKLFIKNIKRRSRKNISMKKGNKVNNKKRVKQQTILDDSDREYKSVKFTSLQASELKSEKSMQNVPQLQSSKPTQNLPEVQDKKPMQNLPEEQNKKPMQNLKEEQDKKPMQISLVLKNTLFKCTECGIHFLSAKAAMEHAHHMVKKNSNWICGVCRRIFKKDDELFHEKQHTFGDDFTVFELNSLELSRVLYRCQKCDIHLSEENFTSHYPACGLETLKSCFCKACNILLDHSIGKSHKASHLDEYLKSTDFTIIESEVILSNDLSNDSQTILINGPSIKSVTEAKKGKTNIRILKRKNDKELIESDKKKKFHYLFKMYHCSICKCYLTDVIEQNVHVQSCRGHTQKYVCKYCGVVLPLHTHTHERLHSSFNNLRLGDFDFFDIASGKQIFPPIPEYFKCKICEVNFITRAPHECCSDNYLTCHICNIKLSEEAFKLHMSFHNYFKANLKYEKSNDSSLKIPLDEAKPVIKIPQNSNVNLTDDESLRNAEKNERCVSAILYCCVNCYVTVDSYDKVVEHCQEHYSPVEKQIKTDICQVCDLKFESTCYNDHQKLHLSNVDKEFFKVLKFDSFYFTSDNKFWIQHVLGSLPKKQIDEILRQSIYKFECRIKMEVLQEGPSHLTVYKCHKCLCFIDQSSLYRHAECSCFKLRKHPCSICGLPFISSFSRLEHEKIHQKTNNIRFKSYRIVSFNREEDKAFNNDISSRKHYILYQCRNCDGTIDKSKVNDHECARNDLKKCLDCGLVLYEKDYEQHGLRHKELTNFTQDNIKIICFGEKHKRENISITEELKSSFKGTVYDVILYCCKKCQVCEEDTVSRHICSFVAGRSQCPICGLYFSTNNIKSHRLLHRMNSEIVKENMTIISYDFSRCNDNESENHSEDASSGFDEKVEENTEMFEEKRSDINEIVQTKHTENCIENQNSDEPCNVTEKIANLYKCTCGLHFLDERSISMHFQLCNPKTKLARQTCSKCDLSFTSNILFTHFLIHHGNKSHTFKYNIIDMLKKNEKKPVFYKCFNCNMYFVKETEVGEHMQECDGSGNQGKLCQICNLIFYSSSFNTHEHVVHENGRRSYQVIAMNARHSPTMQDRVHNPKEQKSVVLQANTKATGSTVDSDTKLSNVHKTIYKCKDCGIHYLTKPTMKLHLREKCSYLPKLQDICNICGLHFSPSILARHIYIHHEKFNLCINDLIIE